VGVLFPDGADDTIRLMGKPEHAIGIVKQYTGQPYTYYFGSAWSLYDVPTMRHWQLLAEDCLRAVKTPLKVALKTIEP